MVNGQRFYERLMEVGKIGYKDNEGVSCLAFTKEDLEALELVKKYMLEAGLEVRQDAAGNLIGRREGLDPNAKVVMVGSHIDTVYNGGKYDGRVGVIGGIEAVQTMNENNITSLHPIEIWVYRDEEGTRFLHKLSGSSCVVGFTKEAKLDTVDKDGISLGEALEFSGIDYKEIKNAKLADDYARAHLELHIEQGGFLESKDLSVGVVSGIAGIRKVEIKIRGLASHAGATPMDLRHDALTAAAQLILDIEDLACKSQTTVATVGRIQAYPGGSNIIPGMVNFTIDVRDQSTEKRNKLINKVLERGRRICRERGVEFEYQLAGSGVPGARCSEEIQKMIEKSCEDLNIPTVRMPSGAAHDSMYFADFCQLGMGMIFIRSIGGISHNPKEYSTKEDCLKGVNVLYQTILKLAN